MKVNEFDRKRHLSCLSLSHPLHDDFSSKLQHQNLVQLYGVCSKHRPIFIVTEYMKHGSLLNYLRRHENTLSGNVGMLLDMCIQVFKLLPYRKSAREAKHIIRFGFKLTVLILHGFTCLPHPNYIYKLLKRK